MGDEQHEEDSSFVLPVLREEQGILHREAGGKRLQDLWREEKELKGNS